MHEIEADPTIAQHCEQLIARLGRREQKIIDRRKFQFLFNYFFETVQLLRYNNIAESDLGIEAHHMQQAATYIGIYAANCAEPGSVIALDIAGVRVELEATPFQDHSFVMIESFYLAVLVGNASVLEALKSFDPAQLFHSSKAGMQYQLQFQHFYNAYVFDGAIEPSYLDEMQLIAESTEEVFAEFKPDYSYKIYLLQPLVDAIIAIDMGRANQAQDAIRSALDRHEEYWGSSQIIDPGAPPLWRTSEGWISLCIASIIKLATNRGLDIDIDSGYAPARWQALNG